MALQARVVYDFQGVSSNGELNIKENEVLNIIRQDVGDGWWEAENSQGQRGLVPEAYCEISEGNDGGVPSPGSSVSSPTDLNRQGSITDPADDGWDDDWEDDEQGTQETMNEDATSNKLTDSKKRRKPPSPGQNGRGNRGGHQLTKSNSFHSSHPSNLSPLQRSLAASMHGPSSTLPHRSSTMQAVREEYATPWGQGDSDDESSIGSMSRRVSPELQSPNGTLGSQYSHDTLSSQDSQYSHQSQQPKRRARITSDGSDGSFYASIDVNDSGLNGQGPYGLHGANRHMKRQSEATIKSGTVSKGFKSRFSVFAKSGGEAFLLGATNNKRHVPPNSEVRIVESEEGPLWEDPGGDWRFTCEITNPKKESKLKGMKSFIAYQLTPSNTGIRVSRRYKHFDWLYERLAEKFTLICVPQLPDKQVTGRYEESFIEKRMDGLQRWMSRMTAHPVISQCDAFQHFISCTDEKQWKVGKRKAEKDELVGAALLQTLTPPEKSLDVVEVEKQHDNFQKFVKSMNDSMGEIIQTTHQSGKRHTGPFKREFQKVGQSFNALAESFEIDTRPRTNGNDAPPQESVKLTDAIRNTGKTYDDIGHYFAQQPIKDLYPFEDFLREYQGMIQTFPDMIQFHKHTISTVKECQKQREEQKMDFEEAEAVKRRADVVSYAMMAEINHFQSERVRNFKEGMEHFLSEQIKFYQNITGKLEDALGKFQDI